MKKHLALTLLTLLVVVTVSLFATGAEAVVHWKTIVGVITAPGISNPVAGIPSGLFPWTTTGGQATVDLPTGRIAFTVRGLVLNGSNVSGTRGDIAMVKGTLVCNPTAASPEVIDTAAVPLSVEGDAQFSGSLASAPPSTCANPLFLIRIPANNRWIATGSVRLESAE
jgi:hypothetical protein